MTLILPRVVQTPSPNYTPTPINHDLFVLHDQEGHTAASVAWLCDPRAGASAPMCLSDDLATVYQLVPLDLKSWHACAFNGRSTALEMPGFAAKGFADDLLRVSALIAAWTCRVYAIPLVWAQGGAGRGLCCHHDLGAAGGGHTDIGPIGGDAWRRFLDFTRAADAELAKLASLPDFALKGLPSRADVTHVVSPSAPSPSHDGAPRSEPGDTHAHPTPSGFPAHSVAALQADLNTLIGAGLTVDGWYGANTGIAVASFQSRRGLFVDGKCGAHTWAAIDAALAA